RRGTDQLARGRQPRGDLVVRVTHLAAEDEETVVAAEVLRQLVPGVRLAHVERDGRLAQPRAHAAGRAGPLVLDDEQGRRRGRGSHVATLCPPGARTPNGPSGDRPGP